MPLRRLFQFKLFNSAMGGKNRNLTIRPDSVVHSIIYDEQMQKAAGVRVIDARTKLATEYFAKVIFINVACLNTNLILLNSISKRFPNVFVTDGASMTSAATQNPSITFMALSARAANFVVDELKKGNI